MTKASSVSCTADRKGPQEDFARVNAGEKTTEGTPPNGLSKGEGMVNPDKAKRRKSNIALNDALYGQRATEITRVSYKLYRQRWVGLAQLVLLNFLFGWNTLLSTSDTAADYFHVTKRATSAVALSYIGIQCSLAPLVIWVIYNRGCRPTFLLAGLLLALGGLAQCAATTGRRFEMVTLANLLFGAGASFSIIVPTHYSDLWFSPAGRTGATAVASFAIPAGLAIGQLVRLLVGLTVETFPSAVLITSVASLAVSLGTFFVPAKPPTPASPSRSFSKVPLLPAFVLLIRTKDFWLLLIPFATYCGLACGVFSLSIHIFAPNDATFNIWIGCTIFIFSGLVIGTILPTITSRYNMSFAVIKILCSILGLCHLALIWISGLENPFPSFFLSAILGGASLSVVPIILEFLVDITHPIAPESTSSLCWVLGLLLGAWFTVLMEIWSLSGSGDTLPIIRKSSIFQAVVALIVSPLPFFLGHRRSGSPRVHAERY